MHMSVFIVCMYAGLQIVLYTIYILIIAV